MAIIYEILKNGEPVYATTNLDSAKRSYHAHIGADKAARVELVENTTSRPDFKIKKLPYPNCSRYVTIMTYEPQKTE